MKWTKEKRDALDADSFGDPGARLFPVADQEDLEHAAHLIGKAGDPAKVKARLIAIAKRKGLTLPDAWKETAAMNTHLLSEFSVPATAAAKDGLVQHDVPIFFKSAKYSFSDGKPDYEMTPEDIMALVRDFKPVFIDDNHRPTHNPATGKPYPPSIFGGGKLGAVTALTPSADFQHVGCRVEMPRQVKELWGNDPLGLSARFDYGTKKLVDVALTPNPRIKEAALFSAYCEFAAEQAEKGKMDRTEKTPHHQAMLQFIHDHCAMGGATCKANNSPDAATNIQAAMSLDTLQEIATKCGQGVAEFAAAHELDTLQKIHDMTLGSGAACAIYRDGMGKNKEWKPGQYYDTATRSIPGFLTYRPGQYAAMSSEAAATPAAKSARELELETKLADSERKERIAQAGKIGAEAATFAATHAAKLTPSIQGAVVDVYRRLAAADAAQHAEFGAQGGGTSGVAALQSLFAELADLRLTEEVVPGDTRVLFSREETTLTPEEKDRLEAAQKAEKYAEEQNKLNGRAPMKR